MKNFIRERLQSKHVRLAPPSGAGMPPKNKNQENNKAMEDTIESVTATLTELNDSITSRNAELQSLTAERESLLVDAALKLNGADKLLKDVDDRIASKSRDVHIKRSAFAQMERRLLHARENLAREQERQRVLEMSDLAREILEHAKQYSYHLQQAAQAGDALRLVVKNMMQRADNTERLHIDRANEAGPWMRSAEKAGLRRHLAALQPYPGPSRHIVSLDEAMAQLLARWLQAPEPELTADEPQQQEHELQQEPQTQTQEVQ